MYRNRYTMANRDKSKQVKQYAKQVIQVRWVLVVSKKMLMVLVLSVGSGADSTNNRAWSMSAFLKLNPTLKWNSKVSPSALSVVQSARNSKGSATRCSVSSLSVHSADVLHGGLRRETRK